MNKYNFTEGRYIVVFDLGGTLVDEAMPELKALPKALIEKTGMDEKSLTQLLYYGIDQLMKENFRLSDDQIPASTILQNTLDHFKLNISLEILEEVAWQLFGGAETTYLTPLEGARELLKDLKESGGEIIALSNTAIPKSLLNKVFETHQLGGYFDEIILSSECGWRKPSSNVFKQLEETINLTPKDFVLFVGNSYEADMLPAINRGYKTVYIGNNNLALNSIPMPTFSVDSLDKLIDLMPHRKADLW
ncbi:HAD family hydrolase [Aureispira anguillae]|uniref:HAD family hydrolase n=1 Tax=Aureispira anguillae TaxID=2864201 RepID=A0A915YEJ0_9BACT|nr:HAD family hydrolase [Aureispira anguillae]BDS11587.1 HAD family hydrolase [Aureispira anguillae]